MENMIGTGFPYRSNDISHHGAVSIELPRTDNLAVTLERGTESHGNSSRLSFAAIKVALYSVDVRQMSALEVFGNIPFRHRSVSTNRVQAQRLALIARQFVPHLLQEMRVMGEHDDLRTGLANALDLKNRRIPPETVLALEWIIEDDCAVRPVRRQI